LRGRKLEGKTLNKSIFFSGGIDHFSACPQAWCPATTSTRTPCYALACTQHTQYSGTSHCSATYD